MEFLRLYISEEISPSVSNDDLMIIIREISRESFKFVPETKTEHLTEVINLDF